MKFLKKCGNESYCTYLSNLQDSLSELQNLFFFFDLLSQDQMHQPPSVTLATGGYDRQIRFWSPSDGSCRHHITFPDSVSVFIIFSKAIVVVVVVVVVFFFLSHSIHLYDTNVTLDSITLSFYPYIHTHKHIYITIIVSKSIDLQSVP